MLARLMLFCVVCVVCAVKLYLTFRKNKLVLFSSLVVVFRFCPSLLSLASLLSLFLLVLLAWFWNWLGLLSCLSLFFNPCLGYVQSCLTWFLVISLSHSFLSSCPVNLYLCVSLFYRLCAWEERPLDVCSRKAVCCFARYSAAPKCILSTPLAPTFVVAPPPSPPLPSHSLPYRFML